MSNFPEGFTDIVDKVAGIAGSMDAPWMLIGAASVAVWGFPRATTDVDAMLAIDDSASIDLDLAMRKARFRKRSGPERLPRGGLILSKYEKRVAGFDVSVDVFYSTTEWQRESVQRRKKVKLDGKTLWIAAPEDLILYKLIAFRGKDLDDIMSVLERSYDIIQWSYLARWADELGILADLADIVDQYHRDKGIEAPLPWEE